MEQMGHILAELTKLGLSNIGYELITDIVTFKKNGPRKVHDVTIDAFAREFIAENASFGAIELVNHFRANDRPANSAYGAIRNLVQEGFLKKLSAGNYQRADVKALAPPKKPTKDKALKRPANKARRYETKNEDVILKRIKGRSKFTVKELRDLFLNQRRNPKSVGPIVALLAQAKVITALGSGTYAWGKKVGKKVKPVTPAEKRNRDKLRKRAERDAAKLDGAQASPQEGTING